jgi:hypothetical protein
MNHQLVRSGVAFERLLRREQPIFHVQKTNKIHIEKGSTNLKGKLQ